VIEKSIASAKLQGIIVLDSAAPMRHVKLRKSWAPGSFAVSGPEISRAEKLCHKFAECEWIFHLDADETVSSELVSEMAYFLRAVKVRNMLPPVSS